MSRVKLWSKRWVIHHQIEIPAGSFAWTVAPGIRQPEDVDVNEILFRPTR